MFRRVLLFTPLLTLLLPSLVTAAEPRSRSGLAVKLAPEVLKILGLRLKSVLLNESEGQSNEVRLFATLPDSRLVVARKSMDVRTDHWRSNRFGQVSLVSHVPCEAFYVVDTARIVCTYNAATKTLTVRWPGVDILTITSELSEQRKEVKTTGARYASWNASTLRELEGEVPEAVRRVSRHEFQKPIAEIEEETRSALRDLFEELLRGADPSVRVVVEAAP